MLTNILNNEKKWNKTYFKKITKFKEQSSNIYNSKYFFVKIVPSKEYDKKIEKQITLILIKNRVKIVINYYFIELFLKI